MDFKDEQKIVKDIREYISDNFALSQFEDEDLEEKVEEVTEQYLRGHYLPIEQRVSIVEQVYSSIRGLGLLDSIIKDDTITEIMVNGTHSVY
ncbi:MAG: CpaF family protein, partial [Lachnospiraceae bacterium]|nr:CpaF family protein [Lachnospiraceae bacterium]